MVEADFQRFYQLDLRHEIRSCGTRRMMALVLGLPRESAFFSHSDWAAFQGEEAEPEAEDGPPQLRDPGEITDFLSRFGG